MKEEPMTCPECGGRNFITTSQGPKCKECGCLLNNPFLSHDKKIVIEEIEHKPPKE